MLRSLKRPVTVNTTIMGCELKNGNSKYSDIYEVKLTVKTVKSTANDCGS